MLTLVPFVLQSPPHDTDWEFCDQLTALELNRFRKIDRQRLREALDIGEVILCPDLARPSACTECYLKEDGTHWPYCSKFRVDLAKAKTEKSAPTEPEVRWETTQ